MKAIRRGVIFMAVQKSKTGTIEAFQIPAPNIQMMKVRIKGTSPLIFHKWDEKAIKMILDKQMKKAVKGREVRDPEKEYRNSFYYDADGHIAIPTRNIKQAIVGSARFVQGVPMTILRGTIFVWGIKERGYAPVLVDGKPVKVTTTNMSELSGQGIVGHDKASSAVQMRQDMVTVGMGSADIRFRGQVEEWDSEFLIQYDADLLSAEQVLNLLQRAGFSQGLGEWRPEKNGDSGTFTVDSTSESPNKKK